MKTKLYQTILIFMVLFNCTGLLLAQDNKAIISGIVTDETKMGVIGAAVQIKNESTGFSTGSITNENGEYTIKQLPLGGPYSITVSYVGYGDQKRTGYKTWPNFRSTDVTLLHLSIFLLSVQVRAFQDSLLRQPTILLTV